VPIYRSVQPPKIILSESAIFVAQGDIYALEAESGKIQQHYSVQGLANPTVVNDIIYVNHQYESIIEALSAIDGIQLWSHKVNGRLCLSPTVVAGIVYISTEEGGVYALNATNGTPLWEYKASPLLLASPTVKENAVYVSLVGNSPLQHLVPASAETQPSSQSSIYALHTRDGTLLWQSQLSQATTFPLTIKDGSIYMSTQNECIALSANDGTLLWRQKVEGFCRSEPVVMDGIVYISVSVFKYTHSTTQPKQVRQWQDTFLYALRASDGSLYWQQPLRVGRKGNNSTAHNLSYEGTNELSAPLGGDPTVPFVTKDSIYIGVGGNLLAFRHNGIPLWHYYTEGTFLSSPKVKSGVVYVGANDGYVYALQANNGTLLWRTDLNHYRTT
jgi:outer membrane protein assembly factor BamB